MDFTITDEQRALAEATKGVLARHGSPAAESGGSARPQDHDARLWAARADDLAVAHTFRLFPDGHGSGVGPSGATHDRFRTWKEDLRDAAG